MIPTNLTAALTSNAGSNITPLRKYLLKLLNPEVEFNGMQQAHLSRRPSQDYTILPLKATFNNLLAYI